MAFKMKKGNKPNFKDLRSNNDSSPLNTGHDNLLNYGDMSKSYVSEAIDTAKPGGEYGGWHSGSMPQTYDWHEDAGEYKVRPKPKSTNPGGYDEGSSVFDKIVNVAAWVPGPWMPFARGYKGYKLFKGAKKIYDKTKKYTKRVTTDPIYTGQNVVLKNLSRPIVGGTAVTGLYQGSEELTDVQADKAGADVYEAITSKDSEYARRVKYGSEMDFDYTKGERFRDKSVTDKVKSEAAKGNKVSDIDALNLMRYGTDKDGNVGNRDNIYKDSEHFNQTVADVQTTLNKIITTVNEQADTTGVKPK